METSCARRMQAMRHRARLRSALKSRSSEQRETGVGKHQSFVCNTEMQGRSMCRRRLSTEMQSRPVCRRWRDHPRTQHRDAKSLDVSQSAVAPASATPGPVPCQRPGCSRRDLDLQRRSSRFGPSGALRIQALVEVLQSHHGRGNVVAGQKEAVGGAIVGKPKPPKKIESK